jgi:hypothetical protein
MLACMHKLWFKNETFVKDGLTSITPQAIFNGKQKVFSRYCL